MFSRHYCVAKICDLVIGLSESITHTAVYDECECECIHVSRMKRIYYKNLTTSHLHTVLAFTFVYLLIVLEASVCVCLCVFQER